MNNVNAWNPKKVERAGYDMLWPNGDYLIQATKLSRVWKERTDDFRIDVEFSAVDSEKHPGRVFEMFNMQHSNEKAQTIGQQRFAEFCDASGVADLLGDDEIDLMTIPEIELNDLFLHRPFIGRIGISKDKTGQYADKNKVLSYKSITTGAFSQPAARGAQAQERSTASKAFAAAQERAKLAEPTVKESLTAKPEKENAPINKPAPTGSKPWLRK